MINYIYQLVSPQVISVKYDDIIFSQNVILKPVCMSVCQADIRYYYGMRGRLALSKKLPMALIHECCAEVVYDPTGEFREGQLVVPVPNIKDAATQQGFFENYGDNIRFMSSGYDGFMREYIDIPAERIVSADGIEKKVAAITELVSVCTHAFNRFDILAHKKRDVIGIWGDGSVAYCLAVVIKSLLPDCKLAIIGRSEQKLAYYTFADYIFSDENIPENFRVDHAFECCGGEGSIDAIDSIISIIRPQGNVMLLGVSENKVPVLTRMVLEKGLTFVGVSRSGKEDFVKAVEIIREDISSRRLDLITSDFGKVNNIDDIHEVFKQARTGIFKTVFDWNL